MTREAKYDSNDADETIFRPCDPLPLTFCWFVFISRCMGNYVSIDIFYSIDLFNGLKS